MGRAGENKEKERFKYAAFLFKPDKLVREETRAERNLHIQTGAFGPLLVLLNYSNAGEAEQHLTLCFNRRAAPGGRMAAARRVAEMSVKLNENNKI